MLLLNDKYSTALSAAIEASKAIMKIYSSPFETYIKDDGSPLTKADLESTRIIHSFLDPLSIPITGEESSPVVFPSVFLGMNRGALIRLMAQKNLLIEMVSLHVVVGILKVIRR